MLPHAVGRTFVVERKGAGCGPGRPTKKPGLGGTSWAAPNLLTYGRAPAVSFGPAKKEEIAIHIKVKRAGSPGPVPTQNKGYGDAGASYRKKALKGFLASSGSPQEDIDASNGTLRQRSRMLYMAAPLAAAALKRQRTNVVGNGLRLKSTIDREILGLTPEAAEAWQRHTEAEFALWAEHKDACDATGVNDFYGMQQLVMLSWPMSGDVFALVKRSQPTLLMPYSLRLHIVEADRVRTPHTGGLFALGQTQGKAANGNRIFDGVEVDSGGRVTAYYIANTYPGETSGEQTVFQRVAAYGEETGLPNILQIMDSERPDQYRGVPYLAQVMEPLLQMRRYTESELMAALVQSFFTAFVKSDAATNDMPFNEALTQGVGQVSQSPNEYEMGPCTINIMEPGESVDFGAPTHPNTGFDVFMRSMCEQVGAALEIPADLLLLSFNASYSASRAALLEAWKSFRMRREWLIQDFCRPVYEVWLTEAVARGRIAAPGFFTDPLLRQAYLGSQWIGPPPGQLDPTKEITAAKMAIEQGLTTREQEAIKLNGSQYAANVDRLQLENQRLREANGEALPQTPKKEENNTNEREKQPHPAL